MRKSCDSVYDFSHDLNSRLEESLRNQWLQQEHYYPFIHRDIIDK